MAGRLNSLAAALVAVLILGACSTAPAPRPGPWPEAPLPRAQVLEYAARLNLTPAELEAAPLATAPGDSSTPPLLTVVGWAAWYGLDLLPFGVELVWWDWADPTSGSPVARWVVETQFVTGSRPFPFAVLTPDTGSVWIRAAGVDSLGRQGPFSVPGGW